MRQFFADFPSIMQKLFSAAFPDVKTVILKVLLLVLFAGVELLIHKKENKITPTGWRKFRVEFIIICIDFFTDLEFFIQMSAIVIFCSIMDLVHVIWHKKYPDSDAL